MARRSSTRGDALSGGEEEPGIAIESLAAGGDGVGHLPDGVAVFVPRAAPGDRVRMRDVRRRKRHARAAIAEIMVPGPGRVEPPCAHFTRDRCGGCQWQHLSAEAQSAAKRRIVGDALRRIGGLDVPDPDLVPSPRQFAYRTTVTLTVRREGAVTLVGFHDSAAGGRVFQLERCEIARPELNALWLAVAPYSASLPAGNDVRLKLRVSPDGGLHVVVAGGDGAWTTSEPMARAAAAAGLAATIWWQPAGGAVRRMSGPGADAGAVSFEQVNAEVAALLRDAVVRAAAPPAGKSDHWRVLDLYAGAGDTALPLAEGGCEVVMVELDRRAVERARDRARAKGLAVRCFAARVEERLEKLLPADAVIVNPPRAGLSEDVSVLLATGPPHLLVYVSCDPATLARDLKRLGATSSRIASIRCFDMFPQTSHVETVAMLEGARQ